MGESAALGETPKVLRGKAWCRGDGGVRGGVRGIVAALVAAHSHPRTLANRAARGGRARGAGAAARFALLVLFLAANGKWVGEVHGCENRARARYYTSSRILPYS